jgi:hypothetical protein
VVIILTKRRNWRNLKKRKRMRKYQRWLRVETLTHRERRKENQFERKGYEREKNKKGEGGKEGNIQSELKAASLAWSSLLNFFNSSASGLTIHKNERH